MIGFEETWRSVPGYEGYYEVSTQGRVRSLTRMVIEKSGKQRTKYGRVLKSTRRNQRNKVQLCVDSVQVTHCVSVLVLEAFVGPRPLGMECCHNNGDELDDRVANLRWGTKKENAQDTLRHGHNDRKNRTHCPRGHQLVEPNLVNCLIPKGYRDCLTCSRTTSLRQKAFQRGESFDFERIAMIKYRDIMGTGEVNARL